MTQLQQALLQATPPALGRQACTAWYMMPAYNNINQDQQMPGENMQASGCAGTFEMAT
jgi:hypothetical protein